MNERAALPRRSSRASVAFVAFDSTSFALARARRVPTFPVDVDRKIRQSNACMNSSINRVGAGCIARMRGGDSVGSHTPPIETDRAHTRQKDRRTDGPYSTLHTRIMMSGAHSTETRARAPSSSRRRRRPGGATHPIASHLDDDDGVDDDDAGDDETVEIDARDDWTRTRTRATRCGSRASVDDDRRGTHHVR